MANPRGFSQTGIELLNAELAKRGIPPGAASGAIAGIMGESGANLDPTSFNTQDPGGGSGGIGQWNRNRLVGPNGMLAFAKNAGVPVDINTPTDAKKVPIAIQAQYLGHELDTTYAGVANQLKTATNPQDALNIWVNSYERPADPGAAIRQRSQYLAPVGKTLNSLPTSPPASAPTAAPGAPAAAAGGPAAPTAPGQPGQPSGGSQSPLVKALGSAGKTLAPDNAQDDTPRMPPLPQPAPAQTAGGPMMMGPGGQNTFGQRSAQEALAQQGAQYGFLTQPSLAAYAAPARLPGPAVMPPGQATGVPSLPGTTLNSPSQLQMALLTGAMSPYDLNGNSAALGGFGSQSYGQ